MSCSWARCAVLVVVSLLALPLEVEARPRKVTVLIFDSPRQAEAAKAQVKVILMAMREGIATKAKLVRVSGRTGVYNPGRRGKGSVTVGVMGRFYLMVRGRGLSQGELVSVAAAVDWSKLGRLETIPASDPKEQWNRIDEVRRLVAKWTGEEEAKIKKVVGQGGLTAEDGHRLAVAAARCKAILWLLDGVPPEEAAKPPRLVLHWPAEANSGGKNPRPVAGRHNPTTKDLYITTTPQRHIQARRSKLLLKAKPTLSPALQNELQFLTKENLYEGYRSNGSGYPALQWGVYAIRSTLLHESWHNFQSHHGSPWDDIKAALRKQGKTCCYWANCEERESNYLADILIPLLYEPSESASRRFHWFKKPLYEEPVLRGFAWPIAGDKNSVDPGMDDPIWKTLKGKRVYPWLRRWKGVALEDFEQRLHDTLRVALPRLRAMWQTNGPGIKHLDFLELSLDKMKARLAYKPPRTIRHPPKADLKWRELAAVLPETIAGLQRVGVDTLGLQVQGRPTTAKAHYTESSAVETPQPTDLTKKDTEYEDATPEVRIDKKRHPWFKFPNKTFVTFRFVSTNPFGRTVKGTQSHTLVSHGKTRLRYTVRLDLSGRGMMPERDEWETYPRFVQRDAVKIQGNSYDCEVWRWKHGRQQQEFLRTVWFFADGRILKLRITHGKTEQDYLCVKLKEEQVVEKVKVPCTRLRFKGTERGRTVTRDLWLSLDIPGALVRRETKGAGGNSSMRLIRTGQPAQPR